MNPETLRILTNLQILLQEGLYVGRQALALPEVSQWVSNMIQAGQPVPEAEAPESQTNVQA